MPASDMVIEAFTELAPHYGDTMDQELRAFWGLSYNDFISQLVDIVPIEPSDVVLDVATGTARIPMGVVNRADDKSVAIGLDITPAMLKYGLANIEASGLTPRIKLVCASAMDMPFTEGLFDVAICGFATHHLDVPRAFSEIARVLKEGGVFVMLDVIAPSFWRASVASAWLWIAALPYGLTHWRGARLRAEISAIPNTYTITEWCETLSDFGFGGMEIMAEFPGRRPWYPPALAFKATKERR